MIDGKSKEKQTKDFIDGKDIFKKFLFC